MMFDEFHYFASLPRKFTSYFVTLIPKVKNLISLGEFIHISLVRPLYKLVAKVLANMLSVMMDKLISPNQSLFLKGAMLVDRVVAIDGVIDFAKWSKKVYLIFKVDFQKAYHSVTRCFLDYMLVRFDFYDKWKS